MSDAPDTLYCANHPQIATALRCNRCDKPICNKCVVLTPTGYRCRDCVRGQQKTFETAQNIDYPLAFVIAGAVAWAGSLLAPIMFFLTIFIAPVAGTLAAEAVRFATRRRRSKLLFQLAAAGAALGSFVPFLLKVFYTLSLYAAYTANPFGGSGISLILSLLWPGLYAILVTTTVYYRLAGVNIRY